MITPQHFIGISFPVFAAIVIYGFYELEKLKINIKFHLLGIWMFVNTCYIGWRIYHLP